MNTFDIIVRGRGRATVSAFHHLLCRRRRILSSSPANLPVSYLLVTRQLHHPYSTECNNNHSQHTSDHTSYHCTSRSSHGIKIANSLKGGSTILSTQSPSTSTGTGTRPLYWYACGPTVYDDAHLGHARTYICTDVIRRILTHYFKIDVVFAMGMTDIDDKIINKANERKLPWLDLAKEMEFSFQKDMDSLNVLKPDSILRVSEHIDEIIEYIKTIEKNGKAYITDSGVYFSIGSDLKNYYKLGNLKESENVDDDGGGSSKRDKRDFCLWKKSKPDEPCWESPWGKGRPGWHIECSAATHALFGDLIDMHSGGIDLLFPHHTNEIAQW